MDIHGQAAQWDQPGKGIYIHTEESHVGGKILISPCTQKKKRKSGTVH